jgi:hypothetical protein
MILLLLLLAAQGDPAAARVLEKFRSARPSDESLAVYRHDWAPTWEEARARAEKEKRPIFLVVNTNISGPTNFYTGHC